MKIKPLISVIVPVYNTKTTSLSRCVDSILMQTYRNIEAIIINDGSFNNETLKKLSSLKQIKNLYVYNQENRGVSAARNNGLKKAKGDYIFFLDSDDYIEKDCIETLYEKIKNTNYVAVYSGKTKETNTSSAPECGLSNKELGLPKDIEIIIRNTLPFCSQGVLIKKSSIGKACFNESMIIAEDMEFMEKVLENGSFYYCGNGKYHYVREESSAIHNTSLKGTIKYLDDFSYLFNYLGEKYNQENLSANLIYEKINNSLHRIVLDSKVNYKKYLSYIKKIQSRSYAKTKLEKYSGNFTTNIRVFLYIHKMFFAHYVLTKLFIVIKGRRNFF